VLPSDSVLRAAARWLDLLQRQDFTTAHALIRARAATSQFPSYSQYMTAADWLISIGLLERAAGGPAPAPQLAGLTRNQLGCLLLDRCLELADFSWLPDADLLAVDPDDLPQDAADLAAVLEVPSRDAFTTIRAVSGKIDLAERARVGAAGEAALVALLEQQWPGRVVHVARYHDGFGYDVAVNLPDRSWQLEVKSTTRRGRTVIYLSRHEFETARATPAWRLVVLKLDHTDSIVSLATVPTETLITRSPSDSSHTARWQAARFDLRPQDLVPGAAFLPSAHPLIADDAELHEP
jgi:hypothetical protein